MTTTLKPLENAEDPQVSTAPIPEPTPEDQMPMENIDAFSAGAPQPFEIAPEGQAPLSVLQMEGVASTLSSLTSRKVTVEDIRKSFNEGVFGTAVDDAIRDMMAKSGEQRQQAMLSLLNRGDLPLATRLSLVREFDAKTRGPDMNTVERAELLRLNSQENSGFTPEAEAAHNEAMEIAAKLPVLADPKQDVPLSKEELQRSFEAMLNLYASDAEDRSKLLSVKGATAFLPNLLPFFGTVPTVKVLKEITSAVGVDVGMGKAGASFMPGTAIRLMRERIEEMPLEDKIKAFAAVTRVLKGNKAIFPTQNAHIQSYLIHSLFYKDITGEDYIKQATDAENKAFIHARTQAEWNARQERNATDPDKKAAFAEARMQWERKAREIDLNASGRLWHDYNGVSFGQWLDDLAILDYTVLWPMIRGTVKAGTKALTGVERRALRVAPDATTRKYVEMLQDPKVRKKYSDLLGEEVAETMLPAATKNAVEEGVEGMGEMLERAERLRMEINRTLREGSNVTAQSQAAYRAELQKTFEGIAPSVAMIHSTKSAFTIAEDGVEVLARYGATPTKAFGQFEAAERALAKMPVEGRIVELTEKGFVPATKTEKIGRYFIEVADKRTYDSSRSAWDNALFDRAQVRAPWFLPVNSAIGGKAAKLWNWFYSSADTFGPETFNRITSDTMRAAVVQKLHTGFVRTMLNLPRKEQAVVSALLKQGEEIPTLTGKTGTVFTVKQIRTMYPQISDKAITSYYEARKLADNLYELANTQKRAEYFREGVKSIHSTSGHVGFGRLLNTADDAVADIKSAQGYKTLHVFDPETGVFSAMQRSEIDDLYRKGGSLARMEELIQGADWAEATHVIVKAGTNAVRELPSKVLPKINGYYPHIYQANYIVYGVSKAGNKVAVATANTIADAAREKARLLAQANAMRKAGKDAPFETFDYQFDRSLRDPMVYKDDVGGPVFGANQKVYGSRSGGVLHNASKQYGDHMVDPIEALLRGMELVSHSVTKGNLIKNMEARLYNTLRLVERETGQKVIKDPRKLVKTIDDINYVSSASKDLQKAVTYMQQIDMVRHIPDAVETQMANLMTGAAEIFYRLSKKLPIPGLERLEGALASRAAKGVDPMRLLTEMSHRVFIAGNPVQQFALQLGQAAMVLGIAPRELPRAIGAAVPMTMLVNARILYNSGDAAFNEAYKKLLPLASRAIGIKPDSLDKMVGVLERSGLVDTVSVHSQIRTAARSQATARMLASASNNGSVGRVTMDVLRKMDDVTFGKLSQFGFEAGEQMNRIMTFLSLYRRDVRKGIANLDKPEYIQSLVGEVNTLVGSMLRETSMGYQRGWLKAAFQFVAFQHKMATMVMFSKNLSWKQKAGLAVSQFLLFGSRGAAHLDAFHRAMEQVVLNYEASNPEEKNAIVEAYWHPATQSAIDGLVFDMGVNYVLRAAGGEDTPGFAWNRRLAPGGGSEMLVDTLVELRHNPVEKVFGLAGKHGSKLWKFADKLARYSLAQASDMDDVPAEERWKALGKEGLTLAFSGYDKYLQASVMKAMGGPVSATGNVGMGSDTQLERVLAAALGVAPEDRQAFLEATDKYYFDVRNDPERHKQATDALADQLYRELVQEMIKLKGSAATPEAYEDMETRLLQNKAIMLSFLTPHEAEVVSDKIGTKIAEAIKNRNAGTTAEQTFIDDLTSDIREGKFGDEEALEWETYLRRTPLFERYPQMMGEFREARRQMLTYDDEEE